MEKEYKKYAVLGYDPTRETVISVYLKSGYAALIPFSSVPHESTFKALERDVERIVSVRNSCRSDYRRFRAWVLT